MTVLSPPHCVDLFSFRFASSEQNCPDDVSGPVDRKKTPDDIQAEPLRLPAPFEWCSVDVTDPKQMHEVYDLLTRNYVEDDDCMFRYTVVFHDIWHRRRNHPKPKNILVHAFIVTLIITTISQVRLQREFFAVVWNPLLFKKPMPKHILVADIAT